MKESVFTIAGVGLILLIASVALWQTPITKYTPRSLTERDISQLFITYITARNARDVDTFLSTLHSECQYMVGRDIVVNKEELAAMLPDLWMQNEDNNAAFGRCMAWECWHENYYRDVMLVNPKFRIFDQHAVVDFKIVSGLFMDDNYFQLVKEKEGWQIVKFTRPLY